MTLVLRRASQSINASSSHLRSQDKLSSLSSLLQRLPSLQYPAFRNFQFGSFVSNIGNSIQVAAILWHVYDLTKSAFMVGLIGLVRVVPLLLFTLFGGVIADHYDRRTVLFLTNLAMAMVGLLITVVTWLEIDSVVWLYVVVATFSIARAFNGPARQSMVASLVPPEHFPNAASVNGIMWRLSDVIGPIVAGFLIGSTGAFGLSGLTLCYAVNTVSFIAVLIAIYFLPKQPPSLAERARNIREVFISIREGFAFVKRAHVVRQAMFVDFWATLCAGADALLPAFADLLELGPEGFGILASASGFGALLAAMVLAWLPPVKQPGKWVLWMIAAYGLFTALFGLAMSLWTAAVLLAATGAADMVSTVLRQTIRQLATPDAMRGRMSSISMLFQIPGPQLGDFEAGLVASIVGVRPSIVIGGVLSVGVAAWYRQAKELRTARLEELTAHRAPSVGT